MLQHFFCKERYIMKRKITLFTLLFLIGLFACAGSVHASDLTIDRYAYGDKYITGYYWGAGENVQIMAFQGTSPMPGPKDKVYKGTCKKKTGRFKIKVSKQWKIGTKFTVRCVSWNSVYNSTNIDIERAKVRKPTDENYFFWYITEQENRLRVKVENVHKGDRIKVRIGNKTYTKRIKKAAKKKTYKLKIARAKAGTKITVWLVNRYGQKVAAKDSSVIYRYEDIAKGMTKKQAKLTIGWRYPTKKNVYTYNEQWCYDDDGDGRIDSYLYFDANGRVSGWQIFDA